MTDNGERKENLGVEAIYTGLQKHFSSIEDRLDGCGKTDLDGLLWTLAQKMFADMVREELFPKAGASVCNGALATVKPDVNAVLALYDLTGTK